jgi:hypothetical protein
MTKRTFTWILLTMLIGAALGGTYLIVERNNAHAGEETPAGFFH